MTGPAAAAPRVVALGGGHGLSASLSALRMVTPHLTAVVTVADDGGSSGRLRAELGALPPGDLRMALAALAADDEHGRRWQQALQHRFGGAGPLAGHAVGNLLLAGLAECSGDPVSALDAVARLVGAVGRVLPMSPVPLEIVADVHDAGSGTSREVVGQVAVATATGELHGVRLRPSEPPSCGPSVEAVRAADWVVLGPGSWYTSVLPHLLVPGLREALVGTAARRVVCLNLSAQDAETSGFSPQAHLQVLAEHAPDLHLDVVLADEQVVLDAPALAQAAGALGARLVLAPIAMDDGSARHDPARLAQAFEAIFSAALTPTLLDAGPSPDAIGVPPRLSTTAKDPSWP